MKSTWGKKKEINRQSAKIELRKIIFKCDFMQIVYCDIDPWGHLTVGLPGRENGMLVMTRADVFSDVGIFVTGDSSEGVIGFAYCEKEGCVVASGNLDDVSDQCCGTKTKNVNT